VLDQDVVGAVVAISGGLLGLLRLRLVPRADDAERRGLRRSGATVGALCVLWAARDLGGTLLAAVAAHGAVASRVGVACAGACAALGLVLLTASWLGARADGRPYAAVLAATSVTALVLGAARLSG
jgi:hypothetical protein